MDKVRCTHCKGVKKVAGLGGMIGVCNLCAGTGSITQEVRQTVAPAEQAVDVKELIDQVGTVSSIVIDDPLCPTASELKEQAIKIDPKRAIYRKKKEAK